MTAIVIGSLILATQHRHMGEWVSSWVYLALAAVGYIAMLFGVR